MDGLVLRTYRTIPEATADLERILSPWEDHPHVAYAGFTNAVGQVRGKHYSGAVDREELGAFLSESLSQNGINQGNDINLITPELNAVNQMIFRDNTQKKIWGKKVLLLISSASTGKSINRAIDCLQYYSGELVAIGAIFSAIEQVEGIEVKALFTDKDLPHYDNFLANECPMCKNGIKVDALINSFGYSKL